MCGISDINLGPVVGEVGQDNAEIDETGEDTGAETPDRRGCYLGDVDRAYNGGLPYTKSGDKTTSVDRAETASVSHEDGDAQDPQDA